MKAKDVVLRALSILSQMGANSAEDAYQVGTDAIRSAPQMANTLAQAGGSKNPAWEVLKNIVYPAAKSSAKGLYDFGVDPMGSMYNKPASTFLTLAPYATGMADYARGQLPAPKITRETIIKAQTARPKINPQQFRSFRDLDPSIALQMLKGL